MVSLHRSLLSALEYAAIPTRAYLGLVGWDAVRAEPLHGAVIPGLEGG